MDNYLFDYIKLKLKNFKETNFNINREALLVFNSMLMNKMLDKEMTSTLVLTYFDKLGDIKLKDNYSELLTNSFGIVDPMPLIKQILQKTLKKKNGKLMIEYSSFLSKILEEYDIKYFPIKDIIDFCKELAANSNVQVRTSSTNLLCLL